MVGAKRHPRKRFCKLLLGLALAALVAPSPAPRVTVASHDAQVVVVAETGAAWDALTRDHGLVVQRSIPALDAALVSVPGDGVLRLSRDPRVRSVGPNLSLHVAGSPCCGGERAEVDGHAFDHARERLEAAFGPVRARTRGRDTTLVAVLDTGADARHPDLAQALVAGRSFVADGPWDEDTHGHGTAMASLVAARPPAGRPGLEGVAPGVKVLPLRVADRAGRATVADVAAGIVYAADRGAQVVLLSLGCVRPSRVLDDAVRYATGRGALVVAAAGNRSVNVDLQPAAHEDALSVAACDDRGRLALATALSPTTDLLAPGVRALAALPRGGYAEVTGSSAAAARVAGLAALVRELAPDLDPAAVRALLAGARGPLDALADAPDVRRVLRAGPLDAPALLAALDARGPWLALDDPRVLPARARPGERVVALARVENRGGRPSAPTEVAVALDGAPLARVPVPALAPGAEHVARAAVVAPRAGLVTFSLGAAQAACPLEPADLPARDLAVLALRADVTPEGGLVVTCEVEGRGAFPEAGQVALDVSGLRPAPQAFAPLGPGEAATLAWELDPAAVAGLGDRLLLAHAWLLQERPDDDPRADAAFLDLLPPTGGERAVRTQYQQSGDLNVVIDAPWRLAPGRPYLPVMLFLPEKGDVDPATHVRLERVRMGHRLVPSPAATTTPLFEDVHGRVQVVAPPGTQVCDDDGLVQMGQGGPDLRLFRHEDHDVPGRSTVVRLPRAAFGVTGDDVRFVTVDVEWSSRRRFLWYFTLTSSGTTHKALRVQFAARPRPRLPGAGHYYDAHIHTGAEWYQDDSFSLLAPRKAWGGPIPMLKEAALALGLTDALDATAGRVITTDHNTYYEPGDSLRDRPPFGPLSVARSGGKSEFERMRELFGVTAGEEVAFSAPQNIVSFLNLPLGAHLLSYRAQHVSGPWHGGSGLARAAGDPSPDVRLADVVRALGKENRGENRQAALYAAHPYVGSNLWSAEHFDLAFERDPATRSDATVNAEGTGFVTKGLQLWNGNFGKRRLPQGNIAWERMNPWDDPTFAQGNPDWDDPLHRGLAAWHADLAGLLEYERAAAPGVRFPRKVFISAGTDAHGDFNLTEDRLATIVGFQSTFTVDGNAFGAVLTYALGDEAPGATPDERAFQALLDGNSVVTDGPLVGFSIDAEGRFDGERLRWTDARSRHLDRDGRIGGGGAFDGRGTALVPRGSPHVRFGYRYASSPEFGGEVRSIAIYRTSAGDPNPAGQRASGARLLQARGALTPLGADQDHDEAIDPAQEGLVTAPTVFQLGAFTGVTPEQTPVDGGRCFTNPVWVVPFDVTVDVARTEVDAQGDGLIPPGALTVRFDFDMSMNPLPYAVELKALDATGASSDVAAGPIDVLAPAGAGWSDRAGVKDARYEVTNTRPIPLNLDRWPAGSGNVTFVAYFHDAPQDPFGNELNRVATTFEVAGVGAGGGTGPAIARAGATAAARRSGGGSGGGCALAPAGGGSPGAALALLALLGLVALRRRG
ncbi:MAG: S8 family serine peptidase [Planctomycetes bacterium]|nr:S8 family serine peptidase [Planctomycetota bacterium]